MSLVAFLPSNLVRDNHRLGLAGGCRGCDVHPVELLRLAGDGHGEVIAANNRILVSLNGDCPGGDLEGHGVGVRQIGRLAGPDCPCSVGTG